MKKEVKSKKPNQTMQLQSHSLEKHTFRTKFKNCKCKIFGPIFCKSSNKVFNIGLLDSRNVVTVRERISQSFCFFETTKKKQLTIHFEEKNDLLLL